MRGYKYLLAGSSFLLCTAQHGITDPRRIEVDNPIPADAEIVGAYMTPNMEVAFVIQSASYPELKDGDAVPQADTPMFREVREDPVALPTVPSAPCVLNRDDLKAMLYDLDRAPARKLKFTIGPGGVPDYSPLSWEKKD